MKVNLCFSLAEKAGNLFQLFSGPTIFRSDEFQIIDRFRPVVATVTAIAGRMTAAFMAQFIYPSDF